MMHHTKKHALSMQLLSEPAMATSLAGTGGGYLAGLASILGVALELSRDGAAQALRPLGNLGDRELLLQQ